MAPDQPADPEEEAVRHRPPTSQTVLADVTGLHHLARQVRGRAAALQVIAARAATAMAGVDGAPPPLRSGLLLLLDSARRALDAEAAALTAVGVAVDAAAQDYVAQEQRVADAARPG